MHKILTHKICGPMLALLALAGAPALPAQAAPPRVIPTVTRAVQLFSTLETELLDAVRGRDSEALKKIVAEEFELRSASLPGRPTARAQWQQQAFSGAPFDSHVEQMAVHDYGQLALVSFQWKLEGPRKGALPRQIFVVDTWKQSDDGWMLVTRYAATVDGATKAVPGSDLATPAIDKKI